MPDTITVASLLEFVEATPVRPHIQRIVFLQGYEGPAAYYDRSIVVPEPLWERVQDVAELVQHDIGIGVRIRGLDVQICTDPDPDYGRYHRALRAGLFATITGGSVK